MVGTDASFNRTLIKDLYRAPNTAPIAKPPICAKYATSPPAPKEAENSWKMNQIIKYAKAGILVVVMKKKNNKVIT